MIWPDLEPDERRHRPALWAGLGGAALAALFGLLLPHDAAVWRMPHVLKDRVATALSAAGFPGLDVEMHGQRAALHGIVETEAQIDMAKSAALTSAGAGGPWSGGVTSVDVSGVHVGGFERPYVWSVRREARRVVLVGAVPSENARAELMAAAAQVFQNEEAIDQMRVVGGAPSPLFSDVAEAALRHVATLRNGQARIVDAQLALVGEGTYAAVETLRHAYARPPAPFRARVDVLSDGLDLAHPELQGVNLATGGAPACTQAFARLTERRTVHFAAGSAAIDPASRPLLDALTSVALHCDGFPLRVIGPGQGSEALSRERAQAVTSYFASQGVSSAHLSAEAGQGALRFAVAGGPP